MSVLNEDERRLKEKIGDSVIAFDSFSHLEKQAIFGLVEKGEVDLFPDDYGVMQVQGLRLHESNFWRILTANRVT